MEFKNIVATAKSIAKDLKAKAADRVTEFRFLVQFQSGEVYQYKANAEGLAKLANVNFDEVIMVQFAGGTPVQRGRFKKFTPAIVKVIEVKMEYIVPEKDVEVTEGDFAW